jgi:hypothetical protein
VHGDTRTEMIALPEDRTVMIPSVAQGHDLLSRIADACKTGSSQVVKAYLEAGVAVAARRAYRSDLSHFHSLGRRHTL